MNSESFDRARRDHRCRDLVRTSLSALAVALLGFAVLGGCGDDTSQTRNTDTGLGSDIEAGDGAAGLGGSNACGGAVALTRDPGEPCGACLDGLLVCDGADALSCHGATAERNACGTCEPLSGAPGDPCGCAGTLQCDGPRLVCFDDSPRNACGGCGALGDDVVGQRCADDGVVVCTGPNDATCRSGALNACGGTGTLRPDTDTAAVPDDALPGDPCGTCAVGTVVCDEIGGSVLVCLDGDTRTNACGGCSPLVGEPGGRCGCDGTGSWACDPDSPNRVVCENANPRNACGGCDDLANIPGDDCDGGQWACSGPDQLLCVPDQASCGSPGAILPPPGAACGPCGDGHIICAGPLSSACVGATELNACGGCGLLPGEPGEFCAPGRVWSCEDGEAHCVVSRERNECGGVSRLTAPPGDRCGACGDGLVVCVSEEDVACLDAAVPNACGGCSELRGVVGRPCGTCNTGRWVCDGAEDVVCEGDDPDAEFDLHADFDGDGFGDPDVSARVCPGTPGYVRDSGDCDDARDDVHPAAPELCDDADNDCDDAVDEDFVRWEDADGDGYGAPGTERIACIDSVDIVDNDSDCYDGNPDAHPGQLLTFRSDRGDGSFDYDCNGTEDKQLDVAGQCGAPPLTCNFVPNGFQRGWVDGPIAECGETGQLLFQCLPADDGCEPRTEPRVQACR